MHVNLKQSEITIEFPMSYLALSVPRTGLEPATSVAIMLRRRCKNAVKCGEMWLNGMGRRPKWGLMS